MPRGTKRRIPGHLLVRQMNGMARCECGWGPTVPRSISHSDQQRARHLVDVRMGIAEERSSRRPQGVA